MLTGALAFGALGLLGSVHCAGMCGGFAVTVAVASGPKRRLLLCDQILFALGKSATYVVLGLALRSVLTEAIDASGLAVLQKVLSMAAGLVLVGGGAKLMGLVLPGGRSRWGRSLMRLFTRAQGAARSLGGRAAAFGTGALTGLLPCGLSWSAFALATQVDAAVATLGLFLFGLATSPALIGVALGGRRLFGSVSRRGRIVGTRLAGALLVLFGVLTALRGGWTLEDALAGTPAPCCVNSGQEHDSHPMPQATRQVDSAQ